MKAQTCKKCAGLILIVILVFLWADKLSFDGCTIEGQYGGSHVVSPRSLPTLKRTRHNMGWLSGYNYRRSQSIKASGSIAGTVVVTNGSNAVVGTSTFFLQWVIGDQIRLPDSNWYTIAGITDNTHLIISIVYPGANASNQAYDMRLINYQMKLLVGESAGAIGKEVDCNSHCQADFDDLRFTTSDGETLLDYWIESISGVTPNQVATVWIEFNSIGTGATTFYMYCGNSEAPAVSSGPNTFLFFDDFELGNLTRWTTAQAQWSAQSSVKKNGTYAAYGDSAATNRGLLKTVSLNGKFIVHCWIRPTVSTKYCGYLLFIQNSVYKYPFTLGGLTDGHVQYYDTAYKEFNPALTYLANTWYEVDLYCDIPNHSFRLKYNGVFVGEITSALTTDNVTELSFYLSTVVDKDFYIDDVYIRKYTYPQPVWGDFDGWDMVGERWKIDKDLYHGGLASARCNTLLPDEIYEQKGLSKTVSWGSVKMTGWFRTNVNDATCQSGAYTPYVSTGTYVQALQFRNGHFQHYDAVGGHQNFPNDKIFDINTWYQWEVILDFENSLQYTSVDGYNLGNITLKDLAGTTLNGTHTMTSLTFNGSSDDTPTQFNIDDILVYSYPANDLLFSSDFEGGWGGEAFNTTLTVSDLAHADSLGAVALTQVHNLAVAGIVHANALNNVILSQIHQLAVQALSHAHSIDAPTLAQVHQLVVQALNHAQNLGGLSLSQVHNLVVQSLAHGHEIENIDLIQSILLIIENLIHSHSLGTVNLSQNSLLIVQGLLHAHTVEGPFRLIQTKKVIPKNFRYQNLNLQTIPGAEGAFSYSKISLTKPSEGKEGSFAYQRLRLKKMTEEES